MYNYILQAVVTCYAVCDQPSDSKLASSHCSNHTASPLLPQAEFILFSIISENHVYFKLKQSSSCHPAHLVISFVISGIAICSAIVVLLSQYKQRSQRYGDKEQLSTFF